MYDLIIIGAGTAGNSAYHEAIKHTQNLLIINDGDWDTTCVRVGCMPSKILIAAANRLHDAATAQHVGLKLDLKTDTSNVMMHVQELRRFFSQSVLNDVSRWKPEHKITGKARFVNANTVEVNGQHYQAKSFILAVGSQPNVDRDYKEILGERLLTTDEIFELDTLPQRLTIIGSGAIGIELAQAMSHLGSQVTVLARQRKVGSLNSETLQNAAIAHFSQDIAFKFGSTIQHVERVGDEVIIHYQHEDGSIATLKTDYLLSAIGRHSLLDSLELHQIDAQFKDLKKLPIHPQTLQLSAYPIFVVGDAAMITPPLQHEASHTGKMVVKNALNINDVQALPQLTPLAIVFSSPEMAVVGQTLKQLQERNIEVVRGFVSYEQQGRARVLGKNVGGMELYIDRTTQKLLGAELFHVDAEHLAHLLAWAIDSGATLDELLAKPYYHPTLEEGIRTALKYAKRQLSSDIHHAAHT